MGEVIREVVEGLQGQDIEQGHPNESWYQLGHGRNWFRGLQAYKLQITPSLTEWNLTYKLLVAICRLRPPLEFWLPDAGGW